MAESFEWEDRYLVIKRKHIKPEQVHLINNLFNELDLPEVSGVFVETDWPEFDIVTAMIEQRCSTKEEAPV